MGRVILWSGRPAGRVYNYGGTSVRINFSFTPRAGENPFSPLNPAPRHRLLNIVCSRKIIHDPLGLKRFARVKSPGDSISGAGSFSPQKPRRQKKKKKNPYDSARVLTYNRTVPVRTISFF